MFPANDAARKAGAKAKRLSEGPASDPAGGVKRDVFIALAPSKAGHVLRLFHRRAREMRRNRACESGNRSADKP